MRTLGLVIAVSVLCSGCLNDLLDYGKEERPCRDNGGCNEGLCCFKENPEDRGVCKKPGPETCCLADGDCDDGAFCTIDSCSKDAGGEYGTCRHENRDCDDGDPCNGKEYCDDEGGECVSPGRPPPAVPIPYPPMAHYDSQQGYFGDFFTGRYTGTNLNPEFAWYYEANDCGLNVEFEIQLDAGEAVPDFSSPEYSDTVTAMAQGFEVWWAWEGLDINTDTSGGNPFGTRYFWRVRTCWQDMQEICSDWTHPMRIDVGRVPCDFDGDGYSDVIVGAPGGAGSAGHVYVYFGSTSGPDKDNPQVLSVADATNFGRSVACAGDVNADGFGDAAVGASGKVYLFAGSSSGLSPEPMLTIEGERYDTIFGSVVASAGDADGDGTDDVLASSPKEVDGYVKLLLGGDSPEEITITRIVDRRIDTNSRFGYALSSAGDVDHDGRDEFLIGAPDNRVVAGPTGTGAVCLARIVRSDSQWQAEAIEMYNADGSLSPDGRFGSSIAWGSLDSGRYQVAVGAPLHNGSGAVFFLDLERGNDPLMDPNPCGTGYFGESASTVGNLQNDGQYYLVVGAPFATQTSCSDAVAAGGMAMLGDPGDFLWPFGTKDINDNEMLYGSESLFGYAVAGVGDLNRDGRWDFAVGAPKGKGDQASNEEGRVFVYWWEGAPEPFDFSVPKAVLQPSVDPTGAEFGTSIGKAF